VKDRIALRCIILVSLALFSCEKSATIAESSPEHRGKDPVILVSIDGYRHDYTVKYHPPWLSSLARRGSKLASLIPVYPSKTFPNHVSIITGMYPAKHGILSNRFFDPVSRRTFDYHKTTDDPTWFHTRPLWVSAEEQGMRTASVFWIGAEAAAGGRSPAYFLKYDGKLSTSERTAQIVSWLSLPENVRPVFLMLYFSKVDDMGHRYGPDSSQVEEAIQNIDTGLDELEKSTLKIGLHPRFVIVSDHGMVRVDSSRRICIGDIVKESEAKIEIGGAQSFLYNVASEKRKELVERLNAVPGLRAYPREATPESYRIRSMPSAGDILVESTPPGLISPCSVLKPDPAGMHGWDPVRYPENRAIFYAVGPGIRSGLVLPAAENVHIVPFLIRLLGLRQEGEMDGTISPLEKMLQK